MAPTDDQSSANPPKHGASVRLADLSRREEQSVAWRPDEDTLAALAQDLDLLGLKKASVDGRLRPVGRQDWDFEGSIGATVTQSCVVTLAPVVTRIDRDAARKFRADLPDTKAEDEVEMPEDDTLEPLGSPIDLRQLLREELALALPLYPRASEAELEETNFTEPGKTPLRDEDTKPFAGLGELRDKLGGRSEK